jgi:flavin-dependent dehydrogenase
MAALVLARAGVRVTVLDRSVFPRDKLCGDSVNPGAMALLARHGLAEAVAGVGLPMHGMLLTGPGVEVDGTYPHGAVGRSVLRRELDALLLQAAVAAGARFESDTRVHRPLMTGDAVRGVVTATGHGGQRERAARVVIGADGRRSTLAFALGLSAHPPRPRRWALGAYFDGVGGCGSRGEMHIRRGHYIGVAPTPGGLTNTCLVVPESRAREVARHAGRTLDRTLSEDPWIGQRFNGARRATPITMLGPLAVDVASPGVDGLLLAGDAAGFVDPMTGDGLRFALRGGELAAEAALATLQGALDAHRQLAARRRAEFGGKLRANRLLRRLVAVPNGVSVGALVARYVPTLMESLIAYAGDVSREIR